MDELRIVRPTWLFAVPRIFEKIYSGSVHKAESAGRGRIFRLASRTAEDYSRASEQDAVGLGLRFRHQAFDRLVYAKLRGALGGNLAFAISGGAALGERLGHFYNGAGLTVLEGYGLTETSAGISVNRPEATRIGTVGQPIPGVSVRISRDGEILTRGRNLFRGYWNNEPATRAAFDDEGWFHTGDMGHLDVDGFLSITGRSKELIVTSGGKNVAPLVLEDRVRAHPMVSHCMVVGDGRPFIAALVTLDADQLTRWASRRGGRNDPPDVHDRELRAAVQEGIDQANRAVSRAEAIRAFVILPTDFSIETGELTPSLKIRRAVVAERYGAEVAGMYAT
jgi:long-chain acyl-CoA synthetase